MSEEKRVLERIKKVDPKMSGRKQKNKKKKRRVEKCWGRCGNQIHQR